MAEGHDRAAEQIAKRHGGTYDPTKSPDVKAPDRVIEVKSTADEIPTAIDQLGGSKKLRYVALPASEHPKARKRLEDTGVGLMNHKGHIVKRASRR